MVYALQLVNISSRSLKFQTLLPSFLFFLIIYLFEKLSHLFHFSHILCFAACIPVVSFNMLPQEPYFLRPIG